MDHNPIVPARITKPIQLLGAWLAGLLAIDSCFLIAASHMDAHSSEALALVWAAIINVPLFLAAVFLLQTRFRPELQEDSYYSAYLSRRTNELITVRKDDIQFAELIHKIAELETTVRSSRESTAQDPVREISPLSQLRIGVNKYLEDKKEVMSKLAEVGVTGVTVFGSKAAPKARVVAISQFLDHRATSAAIDFAKELGFDGYTVFDNRAEGTDEEVLIGSYGGLQYEFSASAVRSH